MQIFELAPKIQSLDWNSDYWARGLANTQLTSQGAPSHFVLHFWLIFFPQWFLCWRSWRDLSKSSGRCQLRRNILFQALRAVTAAAELWEQAVFLCIKTKLWLAHSVPTLTFVEILHIAYVKVIWNRDWSMPLWHSAVLHLGSSEWKVSAAPPQLLFHLKLPVTSI